MLAIMNRPILPFSLIFIPFFLFQAVQAQTFNTGEVLEKWDNACQYTQDIWSIFPDSTYTFHPTNEQMAASEQMIHIMKNISWLSSTYLLEEENPFDFTEPLDIDSLWPQVYNYSVTAIQSASGQLDSTVSFFAGQKTKRQIIWLLHDHQTHHRGQLIVYLRLLGLKPVSYIGW